MDYILNILNIFCNWSRSWKTPDSSVNQWDWNGDVPMTLPIFYHFWVSGYSSSGTVKATYLHAKIKTKMNRILYCGIIKRNFFEEQYNWSSGVLFLWLWKREVPVWLNVDKVRVCVKYWTGRNISLWHAPRRKKEKFWNGNLLPKIILVFKSTWKCWSCLS